jgi:CrcB protein
MPLLFLAVAGGGFVGAPARYVLDRVITERVLSDAPWGTFVINIVGSVILGVVAGLSGHVSGVEMKLIGTGFCGAFTTFSTFTYQTLALFEEGSYSKAMANVLGSVALGLAAAAAGLAIGLAL